MIDSLELIGFVGGGLVAIASSPQLIKSWRTKSTKDLSLVWLVVMCVGLFLYTIYAYGNDLLALKVCITIELILMSTLLVLKLIYK